MTHGTNHSAVGRFLVWLTARLPVYWKGHLYHADGSLYMGRWSIFETDRLSARIHHIATPDYDRHMHDHPWWFVSVLLRGSYVEHRPAQLEPCFIGHGRDFEASARTYRKAGSFAFRRATDRHLIAEVSEGGTWTLVIYGRKVHWWGFYTPSGKVHWQEYPTCHENAKVAA